MQHTVNILPGENYFDALTRSNISIDYVFDVAAANGIDITELLSSGFVLDIPALTPVKEHRLQQAKSIKATQQRNLTVGFGQNMFDKCIEICGNMQSLFDLAKANNLSITDTVTKESNLIPASISDSNMVRYYFKQNIRPATGNEVIAEAVTGDGIGYWIIENDFIIQ